MVKLKTSLTQVVSCDPKMQSCFKHLALNRISVQSPLKLEEEAVYDVLFRDINH